jgi:hypothetical protein
MNYLAFILSIYIFALNLAPCADYELSDTHVKTELLQDTGDNHQGSDLCSPFCVCQCCHISATDSKKTESKLDLVYISTQDFFYLIVSEKNFSTSFLQPPRV